MRTRRRTSWSLVSLCAAAALALAGCPQDPAPVTPPSPPSPPPIPHAEAGQDEGASLMGQGLDPVCKMTVDLSAPPAERVVDGMRYVFCNESCAVTFVEEPAKYLAAAPEEQVAKGHLDPVCGMAVDAQAPAATLLVEGRTVLFCSQACAQSFKENPGRYPQVLSERDPRGANGE